MMDNVVTTLNLVLPVMYGVVFGVYLYNFLKKKNKLITRSGFAALLVTTVTHVCYLVAYGIITRHHPMTTLYEFLSFVAMSLGVVYLVVERRHRTSHSGTFIVPFMLLLQTVASINIKPAIQLVPVLVSIRYELHSSIMALAYSAFFTSLVYSVMFLLFYRAINKKQFGRIFERLPSLVELGKMSTSTTVAGFILLTIGMILGLYNVLAHMDPIESDIKLHATPVVWIIYGFDLFSHYKLNWPARKTAIISVLAFVALVGTTLTSHFMTTGWHRFLG